MSRTFDSSFFVTLFTSQSSFIAAFPTMLSFRTDFRNVCFQMSPWRSARPMASGFSSGACRWYTEWCESACEKTPRLRRPRSVPTILGHPAQETHRERNLLRQRLEEGCPVPIPMWQTTWNVVPLSMIYKN